MARGKHGRERTPLLRGRRRRARERRAAETSWAGGSPAGAPLTPGGLEHWTPIRDPFEEPAETMPGVLTAARPAFVLPSAAVGTAAAVGTIADVVVPEAIAPQPDRRARLAARQAEWDSRAGALQLVLAQVGAQLASDRAEIAREFAAVMAQLEGVDTGPQADLVPALVDEPHRDADGAAHQLVAVREQLTDALSELDTLRALLVQEQAGRAEA